jgi:hypothetical protein
MRRFIYISTANPTDFQVHYQIKRLTKTPKLSPWYTISIPKQVWSVYDNGGIINVYTHNDIAEKIKDYTNKVQVSTFPELQWHGDHIHLWATLLYELTQPQSYYFAVMDDVETDDQSILHVRFDRYDKYC